MSRRDRDETPDQTAQDIPQQPPSLFSMTSFEVESLAHFFDCLVERIVDFGEIDLRNDVE